MLLPRVLRLASINSRMSEIRTRERDSVVLLDIVGSMSGSAASLHAEVAKCLVGGSRGVVLNLQHTTYIDSTWLGAIVQNFAKLSQAGGRLKLLNVPTDLMNVLVLTKLSTIFDIFTSEDDAVNSFFPSRQLRYPHLTREGEALRSSGENRSPLRVFLCHSSTDKISVRKLYRGLLETGARPWLDEIDLLPGQLWDREIPAAVRESDAVLVCLSSVSVGKSGYLQREIKYAIDAAEEQTEDSIFLIPARLEDCEVPERLRRWQWVDLFMTDGYDRLVTALQARALALGKFPLHLGGNSTERSATQT